MLWTIVAVAIQDKDNKLLAVGGDMGHSNWQTSRQA